MAVTAAATFCATLVDEWVRHGIEHAVFSPGSRSTPMVLALDADERIRLHRFHDERSAGFAALGIGKASGMPAPVLTTSGTAAVELHPAVVEASYDRVPMIALTADRPPEAPPALLGAERGDAPDEAMGETEAEARRPLETAVSLLASLSAELDEPSDDRASRAAAVLADFARRAPHPARALRNLDRYLASLASAKAR